eukprot:XP_011662325.1 PREDICTED: uncharacterized protein LOC100893122 [Strongylocentrotus purpuratus]
MLSVSVKQELSTSLLLDLSGIQHSSTCTLSTCDTTEGSSPNNTPGGGCIQKDLGTMYSDVVDHVYEVRNLLASTTYEVDLRCRHRLCGESTASTRASVPTPIVLINDQGSNQQTTSDEKLWIRDLIFVIIAVIVVSAFVIVVTVSVVLRAVVKGSMRVAGAREESHVTRSPNRIEEGNEGEPKIYQEIKELRSSLVQPSDIIVSTLSSSQRRHSLGQSTRLVMRHPRPPPLPLPTHRMSVTSAVVTAPDAKDTDSENDEYVPMSPDTYSIDSEYMTMNRANTN